MKNIFLILLLIWFKSSKAQEVFPKNAFQLELGGNSFGLGLSYERNFMKTDVGQYFTRVGIASLPLPDSSFTLFPVLAGYLKEKKNGQWEFAGGVTVFYEKKSGWGYDLTASLGLRNRIKASPYYYRLAFTPFLTISDKRYQFIPFAGIGLMRLF